MNIDIPEYIKTLAPYVPGKPISETKREFGLKKVVKLASNENPLGPSPRAVRAYRNACKELNLYPDSSAFDLKRGLAREHHLPDSWFLIGNGSNELMDLFMRSFCITGDEIVISEAAFIAYKVCAQVIGLKSIETPMTSDYRFDLTKMLNAIKSHERVKFVFVPNPNNPTGTWVTKEELDHFMSEVAKVRGGSVIVVLDYAYWEYVTDPKIPEPNQYLKKYPNVVVLRTFSKVYGIAGLRVGYAIAHPDLLGPVQKVRQPFNVNAPALAAATEALKDRAFVKKSAMINRMGMKQWVKALGALKIPFLPSQGNFILVNVNKGMGMWGNEVFQECLKKGVILRPVTNYGLPEFLRISIGTPAENKTAIEALKSINASQGSK
ncbi:MAG: histidinol-phosphate transaminase [Xanthomonadaceae bacterium]|nr:histidinol-phosphate transaminase [Xanthomonadaceae bacterium]